MRGAEDTARVVGRARGVGHAGLSRPHNSGSGVSHGFTPSSDRKSAPLFPPFFIRVPRKTPSTPPLGVLRETVSTLRRLKNPLTSDTRPVSAVNTSIRPSQT